MGFFTLELIRMVGSKGRVVALDIQPRMLEALRRRVGRRGLLDRLDARLVKPDSLGIQDLAGKVDFFLAFAMVHEVPDVRRFFEEAWASLKVGGKLLFSEPRGHVSERHFGQSLALALGAGFHVEHNPAIRMSRSALLAKS